MTIAGLSHALSFPFLTLLHAQLPAIASVAATAVVLLITGTATAQPMISDVNPSNGPTAGGTLLTISGSNFGVTTPTVTIGGISSVVSGSSQTQILCTLPAGEGTSQPLVVTAGGQSSAPEDFSYNSPSIANVYAATAPTAGGTEVDISGTNFGLNPSVTIGGTAATVTTNTHTFIRCTLPAGEGTNRPVIVSVAGQVSTTESLSYDAPLITSVTPLTGPTAGGTTVTISGTNFGLTPSVTIGGNTAPVVSKSHTQIVCTLPAGEGTNKPVVVTVGGQSSAPANFSYASPAIATVYAATAPTAGGTEVDISGNNFGLNPSVTIGGTAAAVTTNTHTFIRCTLPAGEGTNTPVFVSVAGQVSNAAALSYSAPSIASVFPATAPTAGGTTVTISGTNFGLTPSVTIGGNTAPVVSKSHTQIVCTLPAGEGTNKPVVVTVGGQSSSPASVSYNPPAIATVTGATAPTAGGTEVDISGNNFGLNPSVTIGGTAATVTTNTHTFIRCTLPAGEGTNRPVIVSVAGQVSNAAALSYSLPSIASVFPATAPTAGGTTVTISGTNFGLTPSVTIGGILAPVVSRTHTQIVCNLPAGEGTNKAVVVTAGGQSSTPASFSYDSPSIAGVYFATAPTSGGTQVDIAGNNFGLNPSVTIGGLEAQLLVNQHTHTVIRCILPAGEGTNKPVVVTVAGQVSNSRPLSYNAPTIVSVVPNTTAPTAGGTTVTISGTSFGLTPSVTIGGYTAPVMSRTHTQIVCTLPAGEGANRPVIVTAGGQVSAPAAFSYDPPSIAGVYFATAPTSGGTQVDIAGNNFGLNPSVTIGGLEAQLLVNQHTHTVIRCILPAGEGTNKPVVVTVAGQVSNSRPLSYSAPSIISVNPATGSTAGGTTVTISGTSFGLTPSVTIGGAAAAVSHSSHTSINAVVPAGAGANRLVQVNAAGQVSNTASFSYNPPLVMAVTPDHGTTAGGTLLTISGANFSTTATAPAAVTIGGLPAVVVAQDDTVLTCTTPAGIGARKSVVVIVAGQSSAANELFSYDVVIGSESTPSGDASETTFSDQRAVIDYGDGSGPGSGGSSITTVTLVRNDEEIDGLPGDQKSKVYWKVETNRTFTHANVLFKYLEEEVDNLREDLMILYKAPTPNGPWTIVTDQLVDREENCVTGTVSEFSYFAFSGPLVPVTVSQFGVE